MRTQYHEALPHVAWLLHEMCLRDRTMVATATHAVIGSDLEQSQTAIDIGGEVEVMARDAEAEAIRLLALQSPVADDLRQVVTAIQLTGNLQRMVVLATHIASTPRRRHPESAVPEPIRALVARMGSVAVAITTSAGAVLDSPDPAIASMLDRHDDLMDRLHEELLAAVLDPVWDHGVTAAVDVTLLGLYYERFADNAVEVGHRTIFLATGQTAQEWTRAHQAAHTDP